MGQETTEYVHTDEDGDQYRVRYTRRWCRCAGDCDPDTLEVEEYPGAGEFFGMDIECSEIKTFIRDLIEKGCKKSDP